MGDPNNLDDLIEEYLAAPREGPDAAALRRRIHRLAGEARGDALILCVAECGADGNPDGLPDL